MKSFFFALQHLSRIRLYNGEFNEIAFGKSPVYFPAVGLILGIALLLARQIFILVFPVPVVAALLIVTMAALTGGIHLDGFMDTFDGMFSGRSKERKMEIMRDSRVGAFGVLGLACLFLLKYSAFTALPVEILTSLIILATVLSRWAMVYLIVFFPYARKEGLGTLYSLYAGKREFALATLGAALITILTAGVAGLLIWLTLFIVVHFVAQKVKAELGGLTGDIYGATCEGSELIVYLAAFPAYNILPQLFSAPVRFW